MTNTAINRDPDTYSLKACAIADTKAYFVDVTGASVTADSSVGLIHRYCGKLPGDRYENISLFFPGILSSYQSGILS